MCVSHPSNLPVTLYVTISAVVAYVCFYASSSSREGVVTIVVASCHACTRGPLWVSTLPSCEGDSLLRMACL